MIARLDYGKINATAIKEFAALKKQTVAIDKKLRALVELRVSQINGCVYCLDLHARDARALGEEQQRLDCIAAWHEYPFFDDREKAALAWAEAVTNISQTYAPDEAYERVRQYFNDEELVDLTLIITFMNAWNRLAISFRQLPDRP
ncbi:carboxymuconolactone decarboxylase family protein [Motiliproteus sp. MSK22-1]|uniref:carboxymuconolactone decarboxylase family protein n=1 Tax=Motiliproteus sp. MSK22-1 TaxID=1897630 RepID=UPI0009778036|nr:carboxymuconolactone decarboxylase family protein [Motiliproteus sp. MSK22-1]OMH29177.1 alkylhydroperoxidase [Motiliproteus sp. MSK22-1]